MDTDKYVGTSDAFTQDGVSYSAQESTSSCRGCAFRERQCSGGVTPPCTESRRTDGRNVIFIKDAGQVRATGPDTSQAAARKPRAGLRTRIEQYLCVGAAYTGTEIAAALDARLNSVTPRFAELRNMGIIKDSGERRDGQIVWARA